MPLEVDSAKEGEIHVVLIKGTVDSSNMAQIKSLMIEIRENEDKPRAIADLTGLDFISSMGWAMFINFAIEFRKKGGALKFAGMNDRVERLFWLMGVNAQVENFKELQEALKSF